VLELIPIENYARGVFRYDSLTHYSKLLAELGLDEPSAEEMLQLMMDGGMGESPEAVRDRSFLSRRQSRFSDGSFGVYYTALEVETAESEIRYYCLKRARECFVPGKPTNMHYCLVSCHFSGDAKDLRPYHSRFPNLTSDNHSECNRIGREAHDSGLAGLLTHSARHATGTCLPTFRREATRGFQTNGWIRVTYDPATDVVSISPAS